MSVIILLPLISPYIFTGKMDVFQISYSNFLFFMFVVVFSFIQFLARLIMTTRYFIKDKYLFSLDMASSKLYNRLIAYFVTIALFIIPIVKNKALTSLQPVQIVNFIIWLIIIEIILFISFKFTKVHFMTDGILVKGFDLRLDLPMNDEIRTHSGFYAYFDIESFVINKNILKLNLYSNRGSIEAIIPNDKIAPVKAYLKSKKISNEEVL